MISSIFLGCCCGVRSSVLREFLHRDCRQKGCKGKKKERKTINIIDIAEAIGKVITEMGARAKLKSKCLGVSLVLMFFIFILKIFKIKSKKFTEMY